MPRLLCTAGDVQRLREGIEAFGFGCLPGSIDSIALKDLQAEASNLFASSSTAEQSDRLSYRANVISLGPRAREFLSGDQVIDLLRMVLDEQFALADQNSCCTFYKEGDHLGAHRDAPESECSVTVIAYLATSSPLRRSSSTGLELRVYGPEMTDDRIPRLTIPTESGAIVVGRGSKVWHERPKLEAGESVSALTACYRRAS